MSTDLTPSQKSTEPSTIVIHHGDITFTLPLITQDPTRWIPFFRYLVDHPAIIMTPLEVIANAFEDLGLLEINPPPPARRNHPATQPPTAQRS